VPPHHCLSEYQIILPGNRGRHAWKLATRVRTAYRELLHSSVGPEVKSVTAGSNALTITLPCDATLSLAHCCCHHTNARSVSLNKVPQRHNQGTVYVKCTKTSAALWAKLSTTRMNLTGDVRRCTCLRLFDHIQHGRHKSWPWSWPLTFWPQICTSSYLSSSAPKFQFTTQWN